MLFKSKIIKKNCTENLKRVTQSYWYIINKKIGLWGEYSCWSTYCHSLSFRRIQFHTPQFTPGTDFSQISVQWIGNEIPRMWRGTDANRVASSAYAASLFSRPDHMSLVYKINLRRARKLPLGTPEITFYNQCIAHQQLPSLFFLSKI